MYVLIQIRGANLKMTCPIIPCHLTEYGLLRMSNLHAITYKECHANASRKYQIQEAKADLCCAFKLNTNITNSDS